jgi:hypothetical protein
MTDWTECPPRRPGVAAHGLDRALDLVRARKAAAQLCVLRDGNVVLDRAFGCGPEALTDRLTASREGALHQGSVGDAIIAACS